MKTATAAKIAAQFNEFLADSQDGPILVTRNGKPVAMLLAVQDKKEAEQLAASHSRSLRSVFEESQKRIEEEGTIPHDQFWRQVEKSRKAKRPPRAHRNRAHNS